MDILSDFGVIDEKKAVVVLMHLPPDSAQSAPNNIFACNKSLYTI